MFLPCLVAWKIPQGYCIFITLHIVIKRLYISNHIIIQNRLNLSIYYFSFEKAFSQSKNLGNYYSWITRVLDMEEKRVSNLPDKIAIFKDGAGGREGGGRHCSHTKHYLLLPEYNIRTHKKWLDRNCSIDKIYRL